MTKDKYTAKFFGTYKKLFKILNKKQKQSLLFICFSSLFFIIAGLLPAQIISIVINKILGAQISIFGIKIVENLPTWQWLIYGFSALVIIRLIYTILNQKIWYMCERISCYIRQTAFSWVLIPRKNLDLKIANGDVINRVNSASRATGTTIQETFIHFLPSIFTGIFALGFIFEINVWCGLIMVVGIIVAFLLGVWRIKLESKVMTCAEIQQSENSSYIVNTLKNLPIVHLFQNSSREKEIFKEKNEKYLVYFKKHSKIWSYYWFMSNASKYLCICGIFLITIFVPNAINIGLLYVVLNYLELVYEPIQNFGRTVGEVIQEGITLERLEELRPNEKEMLYVQKDKRLKNKKIESIILKDVSVKFDSGKMIKNINLNLEKNKITILKGSSGKGKTTAMRIICGITEKFKGKILVNGIEVENMFPYLDNISVAMQSESIFNRSIVENIFYAKNKIPSAKQKAVLKELNIEDLKKREFISETTDIEMQNKLSGGEKKRINVARTLIKKADLYIFDEPTNELDNANTLKVIKLITRLKKSSMVFVISHDARLYDYADELVEL